MTSNNWLIHGNTKYEISLAEERHVPSLRLLLNSAYKELADRGLNYTATFQDEAETLKQIRSGRAYLFFDQDRLIGTINIREENWFTNRNSAYLGKFAVLPSLKKNGLGGKIMVFAEALALSEGYESLQLDTAKPAEHLVNWYQKLGYKIIGETHFEGKTYDSWIFEKVL